MVTKQVFAEFVERPARPAVAICSVCEGTGRCIRCQGSGQVADRECPECAGYGECGWCGHEPGATKTVERSVMGRPLALTSGDAERIRLLRAAGVSEAEMAAEYGVHRNTIRNTIARRRTEDSPVRTLPENRKTIALCSGGSISVSVRFSLFEIDRHDRDFVFDLIDRLQSYEHEPREGRT